MKEHMSDDERRAIVTRIRWISRHVASLARVSPGSHPDRERAFTVDDIAKGGSRR